MKAEKLVLVCARCKGDLIVTLANGPFCVECPACSGKVDAAEKILSHMREILEKVS